MTKEAEIHYAVGLSEVERRHARDKPFSDPHRGRYLQQMGVVLDLLPSPPARVLDMGCGTGWTTELLVRSGYDAVGVDLAPEMIELARMVESRRDIEFVCGDYEALPRLGLFDGVLFFDSLHHADDERSALSAAFDALTPNGVVVLSEPGLGHHLTPESQRAMKDFGVTEKEMPPADIIRLARSIGFTSWKALPYGFEILDELDSSIAAKPAVPTHGFRARAKDLVKRMVAAPTVRALGGPSASFPSTVAEYGFMRHLRATVVDFEACGRGGFTVLRKGT